ncbi:cytochrome P450 2 sub U member 1 [Branchiostoma belcheri]|nr:cytochrome P450 2 sub U member 1 [Branchiostoma belcheri]
MANVGTLVRYSLPRYLASFRAFVDSFEVSRERYSVSYWAMAPDSVLCEPGADLRVLGIGSGSGDIDSAILKKLLQRHNSVYNRIVEPSGEMIGRYKALVRDDTSLGAVKCDWRQQTAEEYFQTKGDTKFHLVHGVHVLYNVEDMHATLRNMWEQVTDGGYMMVALESDKSEQGKLYHKLWDEFGQGDRLKTSFRTSGDVRQWFDARGISYVTSEDELNINVTECFKEDSETGKSLLEFLTFTPFVSKKPEIRSTAWRRMLPNSPRTFNHVFKLIFVDGTVRASESPGSGKPVRVVSQEREDEGPVQEYRGQELSAPSLVLLWDEVTKAVDDVADNTIYKSAGYTFCNLVNGLYQTAEDAPRADSMADLFTGKFYLTFIDLAKKYGDVFSLRRGMTDVVVLNSLTAVREALVEKSVDFAGRPHTQSYDIMSEGRRNMAFTDYDPVWKQHGKLIKSALRFKLEDEDFQNLVKFRKEQYKRQIPLGDIYPSLGFLPNQAKTDLQKRMDPVLEYFKRQVDRNRREFNPNNLRDVTDHMIKAQKEAEEGGELDISALTDTHLRQIVIDVFLGGTDTTTQILRWAVLFLAAHPEIQEKVAAELDSVVGRDRLPELSDRQATPYTEATVTEVLRMGLIDALSLPHATTADTILRGYHIPKGTVVLPNLWALHHDPSIWGDPHSFRPERFLDEGGRLMPKPAAWMPFSVGRRACPGAKMGMADTYLLLGGLVQNFHFSFPEGEEPPDFSADETGGSLCAPSPYKVVLTHRK